MKRIFTPFDDSSVLDLRAGELVYLNGFIYTARDAAHKRLIEAIATGEDLPFDLAGQSIYYVGPCPPKPGEIIGSAGPTTSGRMDIYTPKLLELGLKAMIGKGYRSEAVKASMVKNKAIYFTAIGGLGALIAQCVKSVELIAYGELGSEAIRKLYVEDMPLIVTNDAFGGDLYMMGREEYQYEP